MPGRTTIARTRIVVISQGLDAGWLQDLLEVLDDEVKACSIS